MKRHVERIKDQFGAQMIGHRPTDNAPATCIENDGKEKKPRPRRHVGDVRYPQLIGSHRGKVPVDQIGSRPRASISNRRCEPFSPCGALDISLAHQSRNPTIAHAKAFVPQVSLQPWPTVVAARLAMQNLNSIAENDVTLVAL